MGSRTCFLRTNFIKRAIANKIKILNPIILSEKTSKKNPPIKALNTPKKCSDFSKRFQKITKINIKLEIKPNTLK